MDAGKIVHAVEQCLRQRKLKDENEELKNMLNLFQICQEIAASLDLGRVQQLLTDGLAREYDVSRALGLFLIDGRLEPVIVKGIPQTIASAFRDVILSTILKNLPETCLIKHITLDTDSSAISLEIKQMGITDICAIFCTNSRNFTGNNRTVEC